MSTTAYDALIAIINRYEDFSSTQALELMREVMSHEKDLKGTKATNGKSKTPNGNGGNNKEETSETPNDVEPPEPAHDPVQGSIADVLGLVRKVGNDWKPNKTRVKEYGASFKKDTYYDTKPKGVTLFENTLMHLAGLNCGLDLAPEPVDFKVGMALVFSWCSISDTKPFVNERKLIREQLPPQEARDLYTFETWQQWQEKADEISKNAGYSGLKRKEHPGLSVWGWQSMLAYCIECFAHNQDVVYGALFGLQANDVKPELEDTKRMSHELVSSLPSDLVLSMARWAPIYLDERQIEKRLNVGDYVKLA